MKQINRGLMLVTAVLLTYCSSNSRINILNLDEAKKLVQNYYESGDFDNESAKIIDEAIHNINDVKLTNKSVVVFDIDETSLSNYDVTKEIGFGFIPRLWDEWQLKGIAEALPQTKRFYDYLVVKNIHIVFLTGRVKEVWSATRRNLIEKGFVKFDTLIIREENESKITAAEFKARKREELVKNGYDIVASIGDQSSDFLGENTGIIIRLPNYLYLID